MKKMKKRLQRVLAISLSVALTIPQVSLVAEAAGEKGYYLNAYAPVRGIEIGETAEISAYAKDRVSNERVEEAITYTYEVSDAEVVEIQDHAIVAKAEGYAEVLVTAAWDVEDVQQTATDTIYVNVGNAKTESTLVDAESIANSIENIETYDWAKDEYNDIIDQADYYAENYEKIYDLIASAVLPRSYATVLDNGTAANTNIVPTTGTNLLSEIGYYSWIVDPLNDPWKVTDPISGDKFPSNDFGAYYESGLNEYGEFEPALADESLLVNELYPEKDATWGVDDGFIATFDDETSGGATRTFISYYIHFGLWLNNGAIDATGQPYESSGLLQQSITYLTKAYELTGDEKYSNAGAIILDRIADVYPEMDVAYCTEYSNSDGGRNKGGAVGAIWETEFIAAFAKGYDAFFEAYENEEVITFLSGKAAEYKMLNKKEDANAIRQNVEDGLLREINSKVRDCEIIGNFGMHQEALIAAAAALDTMPESKNWIDFMFQDGKETGGKLTGGNIYNQLYTVVDSNGLGNEVAPGYNFLWIDSITKIADILDKYEGYTSENLYENSKVQLMFTALTKFILEDGSLNIGDNGTCSVQEINYDIETALLGYQITGDESLAQLAYKLNGNTVEGLHYSIDEKDPESIQAEVQKIIDEKGEFKNESTNLADNGLHYLVSGDGDSSREAWMTTSSNGGHGHWDKLNLGIYAYGIDMIPDLGYPEAATSNSRDKLYHQRYKWIANTISHNTVQMNRVYQASTTSDAQTELFDTQDGFQIMDISDVTAYSGISDYRRTVYMVDVDDENSYYLDIFNADGSNYQTYSTHALSQTIESTSLNFVETGYDSYANYHWKSTAFPYEYWVYWSNQVGNSGYSWMKNPLAAENVTGDFDITFVIENENQNILADDGYRLKFTSLNGDMQFNGITLVDGVPTQKPGAPESLKYLLLERVDTENMLESQFKAVYEPYQGESNIASITIPEVESEDDSVVAVKVELKNGRVDYLYFSENGSAAVIDGKIAVEAKHAMVSYQDGAIVKQYVNEGTVNDIESKEYSGIIKAFEEADEVTLTLNTDTVLTDEELIQISGKTIYITDVADASESAITIESARRGVDENEVVVVLQDVSLINGLVDGTDLSQGFTYSVAVGDTIQIKNPTYAESGKHVLKITKQPENVEAYKGETAKVTVEAIGEGLTYTWYYKNPGNKKFYKSGDQFVSEDGATYSIPMYAWRDGQEIYCVITDANGDSVQSNTVTLSMSSGSVAIVTQPEDVVVEAIGDTATVSVDATGEGLTYTWYYKNPGNVKFYVSGDAFVIGDGSTYSIPMYNWRDGQQVYCVITDATGATVQTNTVTLTMQK